MSDESQTRDPIFEQLIVRYLIFRSDWYCTAAATGDLISKGESFEKMEAAGLSVLRYSCLTLDSIRRKISIVLELPELYMMLKEDEYSGEDLLHHFLVSLIEK